MTGVIFDLDGTLLDTLQDLLDATNHALAAFGYPPRTLEELRSFIGNGAANQIRCALPEGVGEETVQKVLSLYKSYYTAHCQEKTAPYPGIPEQLAILGERYSMAIVSNKPDGAVKALCEVFFPGIPALGEQPGCPRKPAPDMLFAGARAIGAERFVYVGDSEVDIRTAANGGMPCLSVLWGFRDRDALVEAGAEYLCADPRELARAVEDMINREENLWPMNSTP